MAQTPYLDLIWTYLDLGSISFQLGPSSGTLPEVISDSGEQQILWEIPMKNTILILCLAAAFVVLLVIWSQPRLNSGDPKERRRAVEASGLTDQAVLAKIALEDDDYRVRLAAAKKIRDQAILAKIAVNDSENDVCVAVAKELTDPALLATIVIESRSLDARLAALQRLSIPKLADLALLAKLTGDAKDSWVREDAKVRYLGIIETLTDQALLTRIATSVSDSKIRETAVSRLTDQSLLTKIATSDNDSSVRQIAICRISDQVLLVRLISTETDVKVRCAITGKLSDQNALAQIAMKDTNETCASIALSKLTDQALLAKAAVSSQRRRALGAIERLTDQRCLAEVVLAPVDDEVRRNAVTRLDDQELLKRIAVGEKDREVRIAAVKRLSDGVVLAQIAVEDDSAEVRRAALARCPRGAELDRLAAKAKSSRASRDIQLIRKVRIAIGILDERLAEYLIDIVHGLVADPAASSVGEVIGIGVHHEETFADYLADSSPVIKAKGEVFTVAIVVTGRPGVYTRTWATVFPSKVARVPETFKAEILPGQLASAVIAGNQSNEYGSATRYAAIRDISDESVYEKVIADDFKDDLAHGYEHLKENVTYMLRDLRQAKKQALGKGPNQ